MKNLKLMIFTIFIFLFFTIINSAYAISPYSYKITLHEGIEFVHTTISNYNGTGNNQDINYIKADLKNPNINLSLIKANNLTASKQNLLTQLNSEEEKITENIVGGVNGEFFQILNGQPLFTTISNGEIFSIIDNKQDSLKRPLFYIDKEGNYGFDYLTIEGVLKFLNSTQKDLTINSINKLDSYNSTNLSTYKINDESTYYPHEGLPARYMTIELINSSDDIKAGLKTFGRIIKVGEVNEPIKISQNQILITSYGDKNYSNINYNFLNNIISIEFNIFSQNRQTIKNDIVTAFTGHEYLIKNKVEMNQAYYLSLAEPNLVNNKHARTAIGMTDNREIILFTVDDSNKSAGMTLKELSEYLKSLNIITAINLDGGGSTSIAFENNENKLFLMNDPTKYQREITNSLVITIK